MLTCATTDGKERRFDMRLDTSFAQSLELESCCAQVVASCFRTETLPARGELDDVRRAAEKLARQGTVIRDAQRAVHVAVSEGLRRCVGTSAEGGSVVDRAVFMMRVLEFLGNVVSAAYLEHCRRDPGELRERIAHIVDLLSTDDPDARAVAERSGIDVSAEYDVVVVQFVEGLPASTRSVQRSAGGGIVDAAEVALLSGVHRSDPLLSLVADGGTILVPSGVLNVPSAGPDTVESYMESLRSVLGVDIVAATVRAGVGAIAGAVAHCRELVRLARCLGMDPRLYRTSDLVLEYQLSRPGPGQSRLRSVITPLDAFPELIHTLRTFIDNEANRRASAKSLYVHPNTVDYRLKRIEQLTGVDPLSSVGLMSLHASLVVDTLARADDADARHTGVIAEAS